MKQLLLSKLPALFAALAAEQKLYIPADDAAGQANFTLWRKGLQLTKKLNTVRSAKDLFFPQVENLVGFRVTGKQLDLVETRDPAEPFVLFGVRACDARSFEILDRVFLSEPQDTYYAARRAHGTVVTLACTRPEETCFCQAFGVDPAQPQGDVSCWMDAKALYWQANTEKGEALTAKLSMLEDAGDEAVKAQQTQTRAILKKLPLASLDLSAVGAGKTKALFDRPEWKRCPLGGKYIAQRIVLMPFHGMTRHIPGFIDHDQRRIFIQYRNLRRQRRSLRLFFRPAQNDPVSGPHRINGTDRPFIAKQSPRPIQPFECFNQMVGNTFPPAEKIVDGASVECGWNLKDQFAQSCPSLSLSIPDGQAFFYAKRRLKQPPFYVFSFVWPHRRSARINRRP